MQPVLLQYGDLSIRAYTVCLGAALLVVVLLCRRHAPRLAPITALAVLTAALIGGQVGAHLLGGGAGSLWNALQFWEAGFSAQGALLTVFLCGVLYARITRTPFGPIAAACTPAVLVGEAMVRVGCLLNGCCWGIPTGQAWGVHYQNPSPAFAAHAYAGLVPPHATHSLATHPTQIYTALACLALAALLAWRLRQGAAPAQVIGLYMLGYGLLRFLLGFLRADEAAGALELAPTQWLSLVLVGAGVSLMLCRARQARTQARSSMPSASSTPSTV